VTVDLKKRHEELHQYLDELLACYLIQSKRTISDTPLMDFLKWSHTMTESPTCEAHGGEDSGVAPRSTDGSNYETVFVDLCTLLDAIEKALGERDGEKAEALVKGRFGILEKHGFKVEWTGMPAGGTQ
jgi:hypothetical protein